MRNILLILTILISILSCKKENNFENNSELCRLLEEMTKDDQRIRNLSELRKGTKKVKDSLWKIQNEIDNRNTELLIEITKKRGWVSKTKLGCSEYISPMLIFRHAPKKYWNEIKPIIDKEFTEKRMTKGDYWFIDNHLKGRPMNFDDLNGDIEVIIK